LKPKEEKDDGPEFDFGLGEPKPKLRIDYQFQSSSWMIFLPRHKSVPDASIAYLIANGEAYEARVEDWSDLKVGKASIEAIGSRHAGPFTNGVMVLIRRT